MGRPTVSDLVYVFGPDLDGRRIEEVADPSRLAGEAAERMTDRVVDEVVERSGFAQPEAEPPLPDAGLSAEPEAERSEERRVGDEGVRSCRTRGWSEQ